MTSPVPSPSPAPQPQAWTAPSDPAVQPDSHADASHPQATAHPAPAGQGPATVVPPPGTDLASDLGAALRFAGNALLRNPVAYLVSGLLYTVVLIVLGIAAVVVAVIVLAGMVSQSPDPEQVPLRELIVFYAVFFAMMLPMIPVALLWESGAGRAAEVVVEGGRPTLGQAMVGPMRIILTALLVGVITLIGSLLFYIPGLIASVLLFFAIPASARGASPVEAIKQSVALVRANLGTTIVAWLVLSVVGSAAGMFVLPIIVAIPFYVLFQLGMFERLHGRELPDPARA